MKEKWKWIKDFEGVYQVSNKARVRRVRLVPTDEPCTNKVEVIRYLNIKYNALQDDYKLGLSTNTTKKTYNLKTLVWQTLVWQTFKGDLKGRVVSKDGNKKNCELKNLKQTTKFRDTNTNVRTKDLDLTKMTKEQIVKKASKLGVTPKSLYLKKLKQLKAKNSK